jgi:HlyD family secretion protein
MIMKRKWKIVLGAVLAVFILGFILFNTTKGLKAELLEIQPRIISKTFQEEGTVVSEVERPIYPMYGGKIVDLPVEEGQRVNKGDLLAAIDSKELTFQLQQLQAQLKSVQGEEVKAYQEPYETEVKNQKLLIEQARQDLQTALNNFERAKQLYKAGAITKSEYEDAYNMVESAKNNLERQREALSLLYASHNPTSGTKEYYTGRKEALMAQIDLLKYKINQYNIVAPVDGIVSNLTVKKGMVVNPALPIMTVFQKDSYEVEVFVLTEDISSIEPGMKVKLIQDRKDEDIIFEGSVERIAPSAVQKISALGLEEQRVKVTIKPDIPEDLELYPGYKLDVEFTIDKKENVLVVPKTALFPFENGDAVWVVRNGKAQVQPVEKGFENNRDVVIEKGLQEGDLVILNPQLEGLEEGKKIVEK